MHINPHYKKIVAPIVITVLVILYYVAYFCFLVALLNTVWAYVLGIAPILMSALLIAVCWERIKEIKGGDDDDISKY